MTKDITVISTSPTPTPTPVSLTANFESNQVGAKMIQFTDSSSGGPISSESINVAQKAAFNEYGSAEHNVPPRPFMKQAMELNRQKLRWLSAGLLSRVQRLLLSPRQALGILGEAHSGQIRSTIQTDGHFARNAPSTIAKKGDDKPLIETSQMMNAITHKVVLK